MPSYLYLINSLFIGLFWLAIFLFRPALRRKLLISGLVLLPFVILENFHVPEAWDPNVFGALNITDKIFVEDFLHLLFLGGVAGTVWQAVSNCGYYDTSKLPWWSVPLGLGVCAFYFLYPSIILFHWMPLGFGLSTLLYLLFDPKLAKPVLLNGALTLAIFVLFFAIFWNYPSWAQAYNNANLIGIRLNGIPIEEFVYFFLAGTWWSVGYEVLFRPK